MSFFASILKTLITVLLTVSNVVAPATFGPVNQAYAPIDAEKCLLNFVAISDTHVVADDDEDVDYNHTMLNTILPGIANSQEKPDALVIAGDITHHGEESEWKSAQRIFSQYDMADRILLAVGNHDTWTSEELNTKSYTKLYKEYNRNITGKRVENVYYSTKINGYSFIFLGSEKDDTYAYFSNKQLNWLKREMKKASKSDKPIFVVSHWPLNETHGLPGIWEEGTTDKMAGGMGKQSEKVKKILNKYENVFLISGHLHNGLSNAKMAEKNTYQTVETYGNIVSVNLPVVVNATPTRGHFMLGTGYCVEVYKDKVSFRARNFAAECWLPGYDYTFAIK